MKIFLIILVFCKFSPIVDGCYQHKSIFNMILDVSASKQNGAQVAFLEKRYNITGSNCFEECCERNVKDHCNMANFITKKSDKIMTKITEANVRGNCTLISCVPFSSCLLIQSVPSCYTAVINISAISENTTKNDENFSSALHDVLQSIKSNLHNNVTSKDAKADNQTQVPSYLKIKSNKTTSQKPILSGAKARKGVVETPASQKIQTFEEAVTPTAQSIVQKYTYQSTGIDIQSTQPTDNPDNPVIEKLQTVNKYISYTVEPSVLAQSTKFDIESTQDPLHDGKPKLSGSKPRKGVNASHPKLLKVTNFTKSGEELSGSKPRKGVSNSPQQVITVEISSEIPVASTDNSLNFTEPLTEIGSTSSGPVTSVHVTETESTTEASSKTGQYSQLIDTDSTEQFEVKTNKTAPTVPVHSFPAKQPRTKLFETKMKNLTTYEVVTPSVQPSVNVKKLNKANLPKTNQPHDFKTISTEITGVRKSKINDDHMPNLQQPQPTDEPLTVILTSNAPPGYIIISVAFSILIFVSMMIFILRGAYESWQKRHYRRMDFLVDGMYD